jgi:hypothetical protein
MGGKSSDSGSREMIQMQKQEASEARAKEAARQGRISSGLERIRQAFEGAPVMRTVGRNFDWGSQVGNTRGVAQPGQQLPQGYSFVNVGSTPTPNTPQARLAAQQQREQPRPVSSRYVGGHDASQPVYKTGPYVGGHDASSQYTSQRPGSGGGGTGGGNTINSFGQFAAMMDPNQGAEWAVRGPDGRVYRAGEQIPYYQQEDTGQRTGGIGENFYNQFRDKMVNYYMPQVAEQYKEAKDETTFKHARAGTLRSTSASDSAAKLQRQNLERQGEVRSKADIAAGDLRNRVAKERAAAEAQLYATENPDVAANSALSAISNISAEQPSLSPLAAIFEPLAIGGANIMTGAQNAALRRKYVPGAGGGYGATSIVGR